ncbi:MAG TPA: MerR family transcriptional regulator [Solirubrobacteraceae bacterium]|jgi:MerR family copper efflux transcriptional regulator|nr:MerR family transcriptional regulator [Solirubrobacteraceae bacterium]
MQTVQTIDADALTINEAAETTGWSARMLRYIESIGLVEPGRSGSGYRLYGPAELQRLSTLRELLEERGLELGEVGFALRLERDPQLREAIDSWLAAEPARPEHVSAADWLRFEQEKHQRLLFAVSRASLADADAPPKATRSLATTAKPHTTTEIA